MAVPGYGIGVVSPPDLPFAAIFLAVCIQGGIGGTRVTEKSVPLAILHGEREQLVNGAYFTSLQTPTLWRGAVQVIAHAGHTPHWETPAAFDAAIGDFVRDCA